MYTIIHSGSSRVKYLLLISFIFFFSQLDGSDKIEISQQTTSIAIDQNNGISLEATLSLGDIIVTDRDNGSESFVRLSLPGFHSSNTVGSPELPEIHKLIEIPQGASPSIEIISEDFEYYNLSDYDISSRLFPHQPSISKSENPDDIDFIINEDIYSTDSFNDSDIVSIDIKGTLRSMRIGNLIMRPVQYNPISQKIKVWKSIEIKVIFNGADQERTDSLKQKYYSPYYESVYNQIVNFNRVSNRDDLVSNPVTYLIITSPIFEQSLSEFVDWKTQKGFNVVVSSTSEIGSSTSSIKSHIQELYNNPLPGLQPPSFVLFVGDVAQIPTYSGSTGGHVTDLYYCTMDGDMLPDIYHGRFSANSPVELQPQIDKTMEYEKYEMPDPSYLGEVLMVSGVDASFAPTHGNGQINYGTNYYYNPEHGIASHTYLYPESDASSAAAAIIQDYNEGVGFANYTAHCSSAGWADPSFTVSDVPGLYNNHMYNLMIGNCCTSVAFDVTSFGEAILRAEDSGAIGYIGGTNSTYWDEDYWWGVGSGSVTANPSYDATGAGVYDGLFHENGEDESNWFIVNDAINLAGNLAVLEAGSSLTDYYLEIYHVMGDPSVTAYMGIPDENNVSHLPILQIGTNSFSVFADPYSYIGISLDGVLYGSAFTGSSNTVEMDIIPFEIAGTASVIVTGQNKQPYFGTVEVGNADGPYVVVDGFSISTSDGDSEIEYGETVEISMDLKNVGSETTEEVSVSISTDDEYVTISDDYSYYGNISPDSIISTEDNFIFSVSPEVPDDHPISFIVAVSGSNMEWSYSISMNAYAPVLDISEVIINDNDGQADPGDEVTGTVSILNSGGSMVYGNVAVSFSSDDQYAVVSGNNSLENIQPGSVSTSDFTVSISDDTPIGHNVQFSAYITGTNFSVELISSFTVGITFEDFESGSLVSLPWNSSGNADWGISSDSYEGDYSVGSGSISSNETSGLNLSANVTSSGNISFFYKVSSEGSYDYLRFYIDATEMGAWSGDVGWTEAVYPVTTGEHTFRWEYTKDGSVDSGSDMGWIDYIIFPPIGAPSFPDIDIDMDECFVTLDPDTEYTEQFIITNTGEGELQYMIQSSLDSPDMIVHESIKIPKGEDDLRAGVSQMKGFGGPDGFGYTWIDSDEPNGPDFTWIEINVCGIPIGTGDDSNEGPFELGFPFYFYGNEYNSVRVSTNGFLSFTSTETAYTNQPIPSADEPNALLAPFWDDLNPANGGQMYYFPWGDHFVVQWDNIPLYSSNGSVTFQVVLYDDGAIRYNYKSLPLGGSGSCTVGIENESGTDGLQVVFDGSYLHNDLTIEFRSEFLQPWLSVSPLSGILAPGAEAIVSVTFNSEELPDGTYTGNLIVLSNDPDESSIYMPIEMEVGFSCELPGDINLDGSINVQDVILSVNYSLDEIYDSCTDMNQDGQVNILDIIQIVNLIIG